MSSVTSLSFLFGRWLRCLLLDTYFPSVKDLDHGQRTLILLTSRPEKHRLTLVIAARASLLP